MRPLFMIAACAAAAVDVSDVQQEQWSTSSSLQVYPLHRDPIEHMLDSTPSGAALVEWEVASAAVFRPQDDVVMWGALPELARHLFPVAEQPSGHPPHTQDDVFASTWLHSVNMTWRNGECAGCGRGREVEEGVRLTATWIIPHAQYVQAVMHAWERLWHWMPSVFSASMRSVPSRSHDAMLSAYTTVKQSVYSTGGENDSQVQVEISARAPRGSACVSMLSVISHTPCARLHAFSRQHVCASRWREMVMHFGRSVTGGAVTITSFTSIAAIMHVEGDAGADMNHVPLSVLLGGRNEQLNLIVNGFDASEQRLLQDDEGGTGPCSFTHTIVHGSDTNTSVVSLTVPLSLNVTFESVVRACIRVHRHVADGATAGQFGMRTLVSSACDDMIDSSAPVSCLHVEVTHLLPPFLHVDEHAYRLQGTNATHTLRVRDAGQVEETMHLCGRFSGSTAHAAYAATSPRIPQLLMSSSMRLIATTLLHVQVFPPDAARGFDIPSAAVRMSLDACAHAEGGQGCPPLVWEHAYTRAAVVHMPEPDASMLFNVAVLVPTVAAFILGLAINTLARKPRPVAVTVAAAEAR